MYIFLIRLWLVLMSVSLCRGQAECVPEYPDQCEEGYFCDDHYMCRRCALCEHFVSKQPCAQTLDECGVCLEGYDLLGPGRCVARSNTGAILFWVGASCSSAILVIAAITALCYIRRRKNTYWTNYGPETGDIDTITAVLPPRPARPSAPPPPPYTAAAASQAETTFNSYYTGSSEPLLKHAPLVAEPELVTEGQQMANPTSNYVRLPPDIHRFNHSYNMEEEIGDEQEHGNLEQDLNVAEDDINNNNMPLSRRAGDAQAPLDAADPPRVAPCDSSGVAECNTLVESIDLGQDGGSARSGSSEGSQQLIVQFINNISPVLNLQGNNTRR